MEHPVSTKPRVALVIGGTRGLGRTTSLALAREGFTVVACSRDQRHVDGLCEEGARLGLSIDGRSCDVQIDDALNDFIDVSAQKHGRIDSMVFAAGKSYAGNALDISAAEWDACFRINLRAPFLAAKRSLPIMMAGGGGTLVFVSTIWAVTTPRDRLAYLTAKSGLPALVRGLAIDHGGDGIRANAVAPGYVDTDFLRRSLEALHGPAQTPQILAGILSAHPSGRMLAPDEVADAICFLAGPRSSGVNGQTLIVDGGSATKFSLAESWRKTV